MEIGFKVVFFFFLAGLSKAQYNSNREHTADPITSPHLLLHLQWHLSAVHLPCSRHYSLPRKLCFSVYRHTALYFHSSPNQNKEIWSRRSVTDNISAVRNLKQRTLCLKKIRQGIHVFVCICVCKKQHPSGHVWSGKTSTCKFHSTTTLTHANTLTRKLIFSALYTKKSKISRKDHSKEMTKYRQKFNKIKPLIKYISFSQLNLWSLTARRIKWDLFL